MHWRKCNMLRSLVCMNKTSIDTFNAVTSPSSTIRQYDGCCGDLWGRHLSPKGAFSDPTRSCKARFGYLLQGIMLCIRPDNERRCYSVTPSLIGWGHTQKINWIHIYGINLSMIQQMITVFMIITFTSSSRNNISTDDKNNENNESGEHVVIIIVR